MPGITIALVVFILVGVAIPAMIRNKSQFYIAVAFVALSILVLPFAAFHVFPLFIVAILQVLAFIALVLCAGGLELREFANHLVDAFEALHHGEPTKPIIVPRTGDMPKERTADAPLITPTPPPPPLLEISIPLESPSDTPDPANPDTGPH